MGGFGIDLGTANTVVCQVRRGIVLDEPSVMVVRSSARGKRLTPLLLGHDARALTGRCPVGLATLRPLRDGVIVDLEAARAFIVGILSRVTEHPWQRIRPRGWCRGRRQGQGGLGRHRPPRPLLTRSAGTAEAAYGKGAEHRDDARAARSSRSTVSATPTGSATSRPPSSPTDELPAGAES